MQVVLKLELMNRMDGLVDLKGLRKLARSRRLPASCHNLLKRDGLTACLKLSWG